MATYRRTPRGLAAACVPIPSLLLAPLASGKKAKSAPGSKSGPLSLVEDDAADAVDAADIDTLVRDVGIAAAAVGGFLLDLPGPRDLLCTSCNAGLGKKGRKRKKHPLLNVPVCGECLVIYASGDFLISEEDGHEIYCRWCGDGGDLFSCDACVYSFCSACIERTLAPWRQSRAAAFSAANSTSSLRSARAVCSCVARAFA